jgi:hypothetical protein
MESNESIVHFSTTTTGSKTKHFASPGTPPLRSGFVLRGH